MNKDLLIISSVLIAFSIVVYFICKNKNRNPWGWIIFTNLSGFIFNFAPFILIIVLLFLPKTNQISGVSESERIKNISIMNKEEYINKIFEPFFTTARDAGSRGLGLAIVKALLEAHGGSIKLMSLGRGTSFQITLPSRVS